MILTQAIIFSQLLSSPLNTKLVELPPSLVVSSTSSRLSIRRFQGTDMRPQAVAPECHCFAFSIRDFAIPWGKNGWS